jgi:Meiotically Up-regulated Gene 113 (MUG113) protein
MKEPLNEAQLRQDRCGTDIADTLFRWALEDSCGEALDGWIYVIQCMEPKSVKIGFTTKHPKERLRQLQTGSPTELILMGWFPANQKQERALHDKLDEHRLTGEWFTTEAVETDAFREALHNMVITNALTGHERTWMRSE